MHITIGPWDIVLLVAVSIQATVLAYLYRPECKALVSILPIPFTFSMLAIDRQVNATNVVGLVVLLIYTHCVRLLHQKLGFHIAPSIALPAAGYCVAGWMLARVLPTGNAAFWAAALCVSILAFGLLLYLPHRDEPGHRSPMPVWQKLPIVMAVVALLIILKNGLQGFMTVFPMVGVIAAYEARHSLWTISRRIPVFMLSVTPMMAVIRIAHGRIGLGPACLLGWVAFIGILLAVTRWMDAQDSHCLTA